MLAIYAHLLRLACFLEHAVSLTSMPIVSRHPTTPTSNLCSSLLNAYARFEKGLALQHVFTSSPALHKVHIFASRTRILLTAGFTTRASSGVLFWESVIPGRIVRAVPAVRCRTSWRPCLMVSTVPMSLQDYHVNILESETATERRRRRKGLVSVRAL